MSAQAFGSGAAQAAGSNLTNAILNTPQGKQAVAITAGGIAQGGAALVGTAVAATHMVAGVGAATVATGAATLAAGAAVAAAAAPFVVIGGIGYGLFKAFEWLDS